MMRRPALGLAGAIAAIALFAGGVAWLLDTPRAPRHASRGERIYYALCVTCHGVTGQGSWRARLFLARPGDLSDPASLKDSSDQYLFELVKNGGSTIGRPGMPGFGAALTDEQIRDVVRYVRSLSERRRAVRTSWPRAAR
jgi:mono/diheme cytochrome c family protein